MTNQLNDADHKLTFLNLVLYSSRSDYDRMYRMTKKFYACYPNVKTIYYTFSQTIKSHYQYSKSKQILYIKGDDTYMPGILIKTLDAFEYMLPKFNNYDYIIRTNISTIVEFNLLSYLLKLNPIEYGGGNMYVNNGVPYIQGTAIILKPHVLKHLTENRNKVNLNTPADDISIGLYIRDFLPEITLQIIQGWLSVPYCGTYSELYCNVMPLRHVFYRNKLLEHEAHNIQQMKFIIKCLITSQSHTKILYGTSLYKIDVTHICLTQLMQQGIIIIPHDDTERARILTDPCPGISKNIYIMKLGVTTIVTSSYIRVESLFM